MSNKLSQSTPPSQVQIKPKQKREPRRGPRNLTFANNRLTGSQSALRQTSIPFDLYVAELAGSVGFATTKYSINPGLSSSFTSWLANQAINWEKFDFTECVVYFKSAVSEYAPNGQTGRVILNADYDATDAPPVSKVQAENSAPSIVGKPCENLSLSLSPREMRSSFGKHFVRSGPIPLNADLKAYDVANVNVSTQGCFDTSNIGEIHVRGVVHLFTPVVDAAGSQTANQSVAEFNLSANDTFTTPAEVLPFDESITNNLGIVNTSGTFTMPAGNFLVHLDVVGLSSTTQILTYNLQQNSAAFAIPCTTSCTPGSASPASCSFTRYVSCLAGDTLRVTQVTASGTGTSVGDQTRITFQLV